MNYYTTKDLNDFLVFNDVLTNSLMKASFDWYLTNTSGKIQDIQNRINTYTSKFFNTDYQNSTLKSYNYMPPNDNTIKYKFYGWDISQNPPAFNNTGIPSQSGPIPVYLAMSDFFRVEFMYSPTSSVFWPQGLLASNISFDIFLLANPSQINTKAITTQLRDWNQVTPPTFLNLCTSNVNNFFYTIMNATNTTLDGINSTCEASDVSSACQLQTKNIKCACDPSYTAHDANVRNIVKTIKNSGSLINTDPWCLYPDCASGTAYKSRVLQRRSACSNISVAGIFANLADYSNINMNNVQVGASSHNDNGLNFYSPCFPSCGSGYTCAPNPDKGNSLDCMPAKSSSLSLSNQLSSSSPSKNTSSTKKSSPSVYIILSVLGVLLVLYIYSRISNRQYSRYLLVLMILFLIVSLIVFLTNKSIELYIQGESICYPEENTCTGDNRSCIFNHCSCNIGYVATGTDACAVINSTVSNPDPYNKVINNMPYLPHNIYTGVYYYSTVINNEIYAFALNCNFKFDGEKWVEIQRITLQSGFSPYTPSNPLAILNYITTLNSSMTCAVGSKIYVMAPSQSALQIQLKNKNNSLYCYDTISSTWTETQFKSDFPTIVPPSSNLFLSISFVLNDTLYFIYGSNIYIFDLLGNFKKSISISFSISSGSKVIITSTNRVFISFIKFQTYSLFGELIFDNNNNLSVSQWGNNPSNLPSFFSGLCGGYSQFLINDRYIFSVFSSESNIYYFDITASNATPPKQFQILSGSLTLRTFFTDIQSSQKQALYLYESYYGCVSFFIINNNVYFINGIGDIIALIINYDSNGTPLSGYFVPCYGIPKYDVPLFLNNSS